ncbi:Outer membrane protein TolC [Solimonas aquatica]|uniref:Outer membrane protein TolC n=1 Tax=Solimonas aquatica TaxID=489703 RepID=A0A1H9CPR4_9GAMM|nr:TolC family protein [Solimonas aquatica]SEQ02618.1 Outer membrane protein TolC [Solimonas aquatica]
MSRRLLLLLMLLPGLARAEDALLRDYIDEALHANPALDAQQQGVHIAQSNLEQTQAKQWPELSLNARYTRAEGGRTIDIPIGSLLNPVYDTLNRQLVASGQPPQFPTVQDQSIALLRSREQETKLSLSAPLFAPQLWAQVDAQRALLDASRESREAYARVLVRETKRAYYGAVQAQAAVGIVEASLDLLSENVRVSQSLLDNGKATRDRVLRAEAERLSAVQQLDAARAQAAQARRLINVLRAKPDDAPLSLPAPESLGLPPPAVGTPQLRPEIRQLDASLKAASAGERVARNGYLPTLGLAADYGIQGERYDFGPDADFGTVSLVLRWSLFEAGARSAQRRGALAQSRQLQDQREDLERRLRLARRSAADDLGTALRAITTSQARLDAAEEAFRIAEKKRAEAYLSQIEFLDAERALREARLGLAVARCTALDRAAELELAEARYPLPEALLGPPP